MIVAGAWSWVTAMDVAVERARRTGIRHRVARDRGAAWIVREIVSPR